jgi:hypothetical protein
MTELEELWEDARNIRGSKNLFNKLPSNKLLPNIMILSQEEGELAMMRVIRKKMLYSRCCRTSQETFNHSPGGGEQGAFWVPLRKNFVPVMFLLIYDGRQNYRNQANTFEARIKSCQIKIDGFETIRHSIVVAYHHPAKGFGKELRDMNPVPCFKINTETGDGIPPLLETINSWDTSDWGNYDFGSKAKCDCRGLVMFVPVQGN